jgi:hypothetical protein
VVHGFPETDRSEIRCIGGALLLVAVSLRPHFDLTGGDFPFYLQAKAFASLRADVAVPEGAQLPTMMAEKDGRYFAQYPPGTALLLVPFYWAGQAVDRVTGGAFGEQNIDGWRERRLAIFGVTAANLVFFAGILALLVRLGSIFEVSARVRRRAVWLTTLAAPFWYLSGHPNTHVAAALFSLAAAVFLLEARRRSASLGRVAAGGGALAAVFLVRPLDGILYALVLGLYVLASFPRRVLGASVLAATFLLGPAVQLGLDTIQFGDPFDTGYQRSLEFGERGRIQPVLSAPTAGFTTPVAEGLTGMLVGAISSSLRTERGTERRAVLPGPFTPWNRVRGLFFLMPVLPFAVAGFLRWTREGRRLETLAVAAPLVLLLLAYAKWFFWYANPRTPLPSRFLCSGYPAWCLGIAAAEGSVRSRLGGSFLRFAAGWTVANQILVTASLYLAFATGADLLAAPAVLVASALAVAALPTARLLDRLSGGPSAFSPRSRASEAARSRTP